MSPRYVPKIVKYTPTFIKKKIFLVSFFQRYLNFLPEFKYCLCTFLKLFKILCKSFVRNLTLKFIFLRHFYIKKTFWAQVKSDFKFFSQLLYADAIPWSVMAAIVITEETTTSSSRIFIKILFQELSQYMGLPKVRYLKKKMFKN